MDRLNNDCLIAIFKYLNLSSRLNASKTRKLWRQLLQDPDILMDEISEIDLMNLSSHSGINIHAVAAIFSNIRQCGHLNLQNTTDLVLFDAPIKDHLFRFENIRLVWNYNGNEQPARAYLTMLNESPLIKNLLVKLTTCTPSYLDLSSFNHLERLEIISYHNSAMCGPTNRLPPSLRQCTFQHRHRNQSYVANVHVAPRFLDSIKSCPLLEDLGLVQLRLTQVQFLQRFSNLKRLHFRDVAFNSGITDKGVEGLPLEWIKFEACTEEWLDVAEILIKASNVKTVVLKLKQSIQKLLKTLNRLAPLIMAKNASLELTTTAPEGIISVTAFEFCHILTKLELISHNYGLKSILIGKSFDKLTIVKATNCPGLDDSDLAAVAEWCFNLEEFYFKPDKRNCVTTSHCLQPFLTFWDNRESKQLSIECLRTDLAFGWFQGQADQEKRL